MSFGTPSYLRRGSSYGFIDEALSTLIDLAAMIWDEYGNQIMKWVAEKGVEWTTDKVKSIIKEKQEAAASGGSGTDQLTGGALSMLTEVLRANQKKNYERARTAILASLRSAKGQASVKGAARHGEKFAVSNVFQKSTGTDDGGSDWVSSVVALAAGAGVAWGALWAVKKFGSRS